MASKENTTEPTGPDLESQKLAFEKQKYADETEKRAEDLLKLRAERKKAELEAKELEIPYSKRPAYKTAVFQGIALVLGVASALINIGAYRWIWDAKEAENRAQIADREAKLADGDAKRAKEETDVAKAAETKAKQEKGAADHEKHQAEVARSKALDQLKLLNVQVEEARNEAVVAPVQPIVSDMRKVATGSAFQNDVSLIREFLARHANESHLITQYLTSIAFDSKEQPLVRFAIFRIVYEKSSGPLEKARLRADLLAMAAEIRTEDDKAILYGLDSLFGGALAHHYICAAYPSTIARGGSIVDVLPYIIFEEYYNFPECSTAAYDALEGWMHRSKTQSSADFNEPVQLTLIMGGDSDGSDVERERYRFWNANTLSDLPDELKGLLRQPPVKGDVAYRLMKDWNSRNRVLADILTEPGLSRLRSCQPMILSRLKNNQWVSLQDVQQASCRIQ